MKTRFGRNKIIKNGIQVSNSAEILKIFL